MRTVKIPIFLIFTLLLFNSCLKNVSFDDTDVVLNPEFTAPLIYFTLDQTDFFDQTNNVEIVTITDVSDFTVFEEPSVGETIERVEVNLEASNQFNRDFDFLVEFLDENDNVTFAFNNFTVLAGETDATFFQGVDIANNPSILTTMQVRITITLQSSTTVIDPSVARELVFKSFGVYYLNIEV